VRKAIRVRAGSGETLQVGTAVDEKVRGDMSKPNILFFFPDQHRFDFVGFNPDIPVRTPHLDRLAERGVTFTKAIVPSPVCAPSRACMAAGKRYHRCGVPGNGKDYPLDQPTQYQALRDAGYRTAGVGKFDLSKNTPEWGLDGKRLIDEWGFSDGIDNEGKYDGTRSGATEPHGPYLKYLYDNGWADIHLNDFNRENRHGFHDTHPTKLPDEAYCDNWIAENGLEILRSFPENQPWFMQVNFTGPHNPMDITQSMWDARPDVQFSQPNDSTELDEQHHNEIRKNYAAMIENIDMQVGRFLDEVESRGELDNTLVVFSSDHGEMLGDHDRWGKSTFYQPSVGVPLVIAGPGVKAGVVSDALVELHDLAVTHLDFADVNGIPDADGRSLKPILAGETDAHRDIAVSALNDWQMIWDGRLKLVLQEGQPDRLFDLEEDPEEVHNLASEKPELVTAFKSRLVTEVGE
jgi:arylsulfatase